MKLKEKDRQNIILITCDALRTDFLGCYGYNSKISPNIDAIAKEGILFKNAFSTGPGTIPSFPGMLASRYPKGKRRDLSLLFANQFKKETTENSQKLAWISEVLSEQGYQTAAFISTPVLYLADYVMGYDIQGGVQEREGKSYGRQAQIKNILFDLLQSWMVPESLDYIVEKLFGLLFGGAPSLIIPYTSTEKINKEVVTYLSHQVKRPFFLWIHYMDTHSPYLPPLNYLVDTEKDELGQRRMMELFYKMRREKPFSKKEIQQLQTLYKGEVRYLDAKIGELLQFCKNHGILENTMLIITSDHGDEFMEHGQLEHEQSLYDELTHVPLIIRLPEYEQRVVNQMTSLIDLPPTLCDFGGVPIPSTYEGESLLPLIQGKQEETEEKGVFFECLGKTAYRTKEWKYIYNYHQKDELYNLEQDPLEKNNVLDERSSIAHQFKTKIRGHLKKEHSLKHRLKSKIGEVKKKI